MHPTALSIKTVNYFRRFMKHARKENTFMIASHRLPLEGQGGLIDLLCTIIDPRKRRGVRHPVVTIVAIAVCAALFCAQFPCDGRMGRKPITGNLKALRPHIFWCQAFWPSVVASHGTLEDPIKKHKTAKFPKQGIRKPSDNSYDNRSVQTSRRLTD